GRVKRLHGRPRFVVKYAEAAAYTFQQGLTMSESRLLIADLLPFAPLWRESAELLELPLQAFTFLLQRKRILPGRLERPQLLLPGVPALRCFTGFGLEASLLIQQIALVGCGQKALVGVLPMDVHKQRAQFPQHAQVRRHTVDIGLAAAL